MRNLKRALSLALASVMVLGLMIVGSNAMTADFGDADQIDPLYTEAIDVLTTVGLIDGMNDDTNSFNPIGTLTRAQAAKLLSVMLLGEENANKLGTNNQIFEDVPKGNWAAGYIAYCNSVGILAGNGDGTFNPDGKLTGVQFGKMLLVALGYKADVEGYINSGSTWEVNVATDMLEAGIDVDDISFSDPITREQAAQMVFNTIKAPTVKYVSNNNITSWQYVTNDIAEAKNISDRTLTSTGDNATGGYTVEFGEKYFPDLVRTDTVDDFDRPSYIWAWEREEIGTYLNTEQLVGSYNIAFSYGSLYEDVGTIAANSDKYEVVSSVDGIQNNAVKKDEIKRNNDLIVDNSGRGALTQIFVNNASGEEKITVTTINTWLARALADYNEKTGKANLNVYTGYTTSNGARENETIVKSVNDDDFPSIKDMKKDDFYMVTIADGKIKTIENPEIVKDVSISSYSSKPVNGVQHLDGGIESIISDGTNYDRAAQGYYDVKFLYDYKVNQLKDYKYNLILDLYGNLLGIQNIEDSTNVFFVVGYEPGSSLLAKSIDKALVIFPDGTIKSINAQESDNLLAGASQSLNGTTRDIKGAVATDNSQKSGATVNTWYEYTVDSEGLYTITGVCDRQFAEARTDKINSSYATMPTYDNTNSMDRDSITSNSTQHYAVGNSNSVYITVDVNKDVLTNAYTINDVNGITKGIKNTSINVTKDNNGEIKLPVRINSDYSTSDTYNVFGLFNKDGYVTYAIVIGEDGSVSDNFVYLTSGITHSHVNSDADNYTYFYDAIINGSVTEIESLTTTDTSATQKQLSAHTLYKAHYDSNGLVKEMDPLTINANYNTDTYKNSGYGLIGLITATTNTEIKLVGNTMHFITADNEQYVILDDTCKFFVNGKDDNDSAYNEYSSVNAMLAALGTNNMVDNGIIAFVCDKNTGFATSIIILDSIMYGNASGSSNDAGVASLSIASGSTNGIVPDDITNFDVNNIGSVRVANGSTDINLNVTQPTVPAGTTVVTKVSIRGAAPTTIATTTGTIPITVTSADIQRHQIRIVVETTYTTGTTSEVKTATYYINVSGTLNML